jgi:hypothetical protein
MSKSCPYPSCDFSSEFREGMCVHFMVEHNELLSSLPGAVDEATSFLQTLPVRDPAAVADPDPLKRLRVERAKSEVDKKVLAWPIEPLAREEMFSSHWPKNVSNYKRPIGEGKQRRASRYPTLEEQERRDYFSEPTYTHSLNKRRNEPPK